MARRTFTTVSNAFAQTAEPREYAQSMSSRRTARSYRPKAASRRLTLGKHNGTVLRVLARWQIAEVLGWDCARPIWRSRPKTGLITASDQQGHYVPTTPLHIIRDTSITVFSATLLSKEQYPGAHCRSVDWFSSHQRVWRLPKLAVWRAHGPAQRGAHPFPAIIARKFSRPAQPAVAKVAGSRRKQITRDLEFSPFDGAVNPLDGHSTSPASRFGAPPLDSLAPGTLALHRRAEHAARRSRADGPGVFCSKFNVPLDAKKPQ